MKELFENTILIVDDTPENIDILVELLEDFDKQIAINGEDALEIAFETPPDLILLDIMMPEMSGYEVCEKLRADKRTKDIPVIFLTAKALKEDIVKGFEAGGQDYITKPFDFRELIERVKTQLEIKTQREVLKNMNVILEEKVQERTAELDKLNKELEGKVAERTAELNTKNEDLAKSLQRETALNEYKSRVVSTISHEFRTPITTIMSSAELMERLINKDQPKEKVFRHINLVKQSGDELIELINDVLLVEKFDSGKYQVNMEPLDFYTYFKDLTFKIEIGIGKAHKFIAKIDENIGTSKTDKKLLGHILNNLLTNAFKYSDSGSEIKLNVAKTNSSINIEVIDSGMGMDEETVARIFSSFYRAKNVTNIEGTGMGLSILSNSTEMLKGEIKVESTLGKGSKFSVILPLNI